VALASSSTDNTSDAGEPIGVDPAILWHGAAHRLTLALQQATAPTPPPSGVATPTSACQRFDIHYSRHPALPLAP